MGTALIVVDVQVDFCEGGSMGVAGGAATAAAISAHIATRGARYSHIVASRDYHDDPGAHFSAAPDFLDSWPVHCRVDSAGAAFHPALDIAAVEEVFSKGLREAAYSAFEGSNPIGDNLGYWLAERGVDAVDVVGIATDHCVRATALDARAGGFATRVLLDLTAGVAPGTTGQAVARMSDAGVVLVDRHRSATGERDEGTTGAAS